MLLTVNERAISYLITKPSEVIVNKKSISVSVFVVSFFLFPCSKRQAVRAHLNIIQMTLLVCIL